MSASLITHEVIQTTVVKAKELRRHVEPLITLAKTDSVANRRLAFARLRDKAAVGKLFTELGPRYSRRPGGYTRVLKSGYRKGDAAPVAYIELVDRPRPDLLDEPEELAEPVEETKEVEASAESTVEEPTAETSEDAAAQVEPSQEESEPVAESTDDDSAAEESTEEPKS